jgi:acetolactate synthase-1/2/3 large subunit
MEKTPMEPLRVAEELRSILPEDSILAVDTGAHAHYFSAFYPIYGSRRLLNPGGWTPMGFGPTAIIGAKMAAPETSCICVTGDGGFFMTGQEVITAVEWETPVVWIVFNNQTLGAIRGGQQASYGGRIIGTEFGVRADFALWARSMHAEGLTVTAHREIRGAVEHALHSGRPCVIDMIIARDALPPPTAGAWFEPERDEVLPLPRGSHRTI